MGVDLPDEADESSDGNADRRDEQGGGRRAARPGNTGAETRARQDCYDDLRTTVPGQEPTTARRITAEEQATAKKWGREAEEFRWMWTEYKRRWPSEERPEVKRPDDESGSWRGEGNRTLKPEANGRVEAACDQIADREREKISPAMRAIESQDPDRHLIGFKHRLKDRDRIKDKVCRGIKNFGRTPEQAVSRVPDTIRYTFEYREARYTQGVWADIGRLKEGGFQLHSLWNAWSKDQYKGINSQWIEPETGQRFEVQFHTRISFEAKQLTHPAYERLRTRQPDKFEQMVLEAFQKKVFAEVPVPPGALEIPDHRRGVR
jgi:hypothetical protein